MKVGTKSLLFGAHQFLLHPLFVLIAWVKLFGVPAPRYWFRLIVAAFVHDIGYFDSPEMDGPVGKRHPEAGAELMRKWFGDEWASWTRRHSRSYAKLEGKQVSALAAADKLATVLEPRWLYLLKVRLSGEYKEYLSAHHILADGSSVVGTYSEIDRWCTDLRRVFYQEAHSIAKSIPLRSVFPT